MPLQITNAEDETPRATDVSTLATSLGGDEADVGTVVEQATAFVERVLGWRAWYRTYSELVEGGDSDRLYLTGRPIRVVTSVQFGDDDPLDAGTDDDEYQIYSADGFLRRVDKFEAGEWTVVYTAGYWLPGFEGSQPAEALDLAADNPELSMAAEQIARLWWQLRTADTRITEAKLASMAVKYENSIWVPHAAHAVIQSQRLQTF